MQNQRHLFDLPEDITYLNGAYMSPQLRSVTEIGLTSIKDKSRPFLISEEDFFKGKTLLKECFAQLIEVADFREIAIIPSVSYGIAIAAKNIPFEKGDEILIPEAQFPSNYYVWKQLEKEQGVVIKIIAAPEAKPGRARLWNEQLIDAIGPRTKCVSLPHVHWSDGSRFDLHTIREETHKVGAYLIIDGTQSIGAMPFSIKDLKPDALICGGYKWLMGPYGLGVAYFGERFFNGFPLEDNWINHEGSEQFSNLVHYQEKFKPKAARYDVGESSNFILTPMLSEAIRQLLEWTPEAIQQYCKGITATPLKQLQDADFFIEDASWRGHHLFGIYLPSHRDINQIRDTLLQEKIYVSYRGQAIRVSPNIYNSHQEMEKLTHHLLKGN